MMRSMYSGVSGLKVHQTKMDVIGNNIANVNTIGFKSQRATFNEVFSQTLQTATGASDATGRGGRNAMQVGLGVNVSAIDILMTQGAAQRTDNPFDLMIDGDGFFIVGDGSQTSFTRAGALRQDAEGNLVIPNGMKVQGWPANEAGDEITKGEVQPLELSSPENKFATPEATKNASIDGNLNINDSPIETQIKMYDSLGNLYTTPVTMTYDKGDGTDANPPAWTMQPKIEKLTPEGGAETDMMILTDTQGNKYAVPNAFNQDAATDEEKGKVKFEFDAKGNIIKEDAAGAEIATSINIGAIDLSTAIEADKNSPDYLKLKPLKATMGDVTLDYSQLTQYESKTNVDTKVEDGRAAGAMMGYDIGGDGKITAYYDNGATKLLGQIAIANFDNPAGLEKVGDNLFKATANSGDFDKIGTEGIFNAGVVEMSNVDLSTEFTEMITTQRGYQANSKIITVSDEMLQELVNLKR